MATMSNAFSLEKVVREKKRSSEGLPAGLSASYELKDDRRKLLRTVSVEDRAELRRQTLKQTRRPTIKDEESSGSPFPHNPAPVTPEQTLGYRTQQTFADESSDGGEPLTIQKKPGNPSLNRRKRIAFKARRAWSPAPSSGESETETSENVVDKRYLKTAARLSRRGKQNMTAEETSLMDRSLYAVAAIPEPDASTDRTRDFLSQELGLADEDSGDDLPGDQNELLLESDSDDAKAGEKTSPKPQSNEGFDCETEYQSDFEVFERSQDAPGSDLEEVPEEISDYEGRLSDDENEHPLLSLRELASPNPQSYEGSEWDNQRDNDATEDVYNRAQDDLEPELQEEPEEINSNDGRMSEDARENSLPINKTSPLRLNSSPLPSPKPQSDEDIVWDTEYHSGDDAVVDGYMEDVYETEPNAARTSHSELEEKPEEHGSKTHYDSDYHSDNELHERARDEPESELEAEPEETSDKEAEENLLPLSLNSRALPKSREMASPKPQSTEGSFLDTEYYSGDYTMLDRYMEEVYGQPQNDLDPEVEAEPEEICDSEVMLEENSLPINKTSPLSLNSSRLPSPKPQRDEHLFSDTENRSDDDATENRYLEDAYETAQEDHVLPEPNTARTSGFEPEEEPEENSDNEGRISEDDKENSLPINKTSPLLSKSSPLPSPKPQSDEGSDCDSDLQSEKDVMEDDYERAQDDLVSSLSEISDDEGMPEKWKENEDLTQSSASDDLESFMQELDSSSLDYRDTVKVQDIFRAYKRTVQTLKNKNSHLSDKVNQLEMEKVDLNNSLDEARECAQTEVDHLKHKLKREQENRRQVTASHNATKDKLLRTEEQNQLQVQENQQMEVHLRNCELEKQTLVTNMKQLEQEHSETQKLLHRQQEVKKEKDKLLQKTSIQQEQIQRLNSELERLQANSRLTEILLLEENQTLKEQLQNAETEAKANRDALSQNADCKQQMAELRSELDLMTKDAEKSLQREKMISQRLKDRLRADGIRHREEVSALSLKLSKAEFENNRLQNDQQRVILQLKEMELLVKRLEETVQRLETAKSTMEADLKMQYERLKRKALKIREQKNEAETRLNQETNTNSELQKELWSLKHSEQKRLDELQELRRQMDFAQREHSLTEERTRHELQHKLELNLLLQSKAASQTAQDQINANNAACLRSRLEQRIQELESEVSLGRSSLGQQDAIRMELETYKSMYSEENLLRKALEARLQRTNTAQSTVSGRSSAFGPSPSDSGENYRTSMKSELDRAITKELSSSNVRLTSVAAMDPASAASQEYLDQLRRNYWC